VGTGGIPIHAELTGAHGNRGLRNDGGHLTMRRLLRRTLDSIFYIHLGQNALDTLLISRYTFAGF
jgi:hypothetical protein